MAILLGALALLGLIETASASAAAGTFSATPRNYAAGTNPSSVATRDLTGDGVPDLVTANQGSNDVTVRLGDGLGGFGAAKSYPAGIRPRSVAIGDFNGDGSLDLAVADDGGGVSILLGDGKGGFGSPTNYSAGTEPAYVAVGDFNGDGKLDLVVVNVNLSGTNVWILLGDGKGAFTASHDYAVGYCGGNGCIDVETVAVGDFNNDGKSDLVFTNDFYDNSVYVLQGVGDGTFDNLQKYPSGVNNARSVAVADLNGDGRLDLAVSGWDGARKTGAVSVLLGDGKAGFGPPTSNDVLNFSTSVAVGDVNGDGLPDLVATTSGDTGSTNDGVSILTGDGNGGFRAPTNYPVGSEPVGVAIGDFNGDNLPDIAVANYNSNNVSVLLNSPDTTAPTITIRSPRDVSTGQTYAQGDPIPADYSCTDEPGGSGVASCSGSWWSGWSVDGDTPGDQVFRVTATDKAGNTSTKEVTYRVTPAGGPVRPPRNGYGFGDGIELAPPSPTPPASAASTSPRAPGPATSGLAPASSNFTLSRPSIGRDGTLAIPVTAPGPGSFTAMATMSASSVTSAGLQGARKQCKKGFLRKGKKCKATTANYGSGSANAATAGAVTITIHPNAAARRALGKGKRMSVALVVTFRSAAGGTVATESGTVNVRLKKKSKRG